jgi:hypothetical protein
MTQWLLNLPPLESYLVAVPAVMLGAILFLGGVILLLDTRHRNGATALSLAEIPARPAYPALAGMAFGAGTSPSAEM